MTPSCAASLAGSQRRLAEILSVSRPSVSRWIVAGEMPHAQIEALRHLRPQWFDEPLPEGHRTLLKFQWPPRAGAAA